jgi:hypothetical protein
MAKSQADALFERLHANGLRKRVARDLSKALSKANGTRASSAATATIAELRRLVADLEARATGGGTTDADRSAAAKKAAATRKREANKRSAAAKKAAQTRAKSTRSTSSARSTSGRSTSGRSTSSRSSGSRTTTRSGSRSS